MRPTGVKTARTTAPRRTSETSTPIRSASPAHPGDLAIVRSRTGPLGRARRALGPGRCGADFHGHMIGTGARCSQSGISPSASRRRFRRAVAIMGVPAVTRTETPMAHLPDNHRSSASRTAWSAAATNASRRCLCGRGALALGVDPIVVRLAVCILALANGAGLLVYLVAWAILPEELRGRAGSDRRQPEHEAEQRWPSRWLHHRGAAVGPLGDAVLPRPPCGRPWWRPPASVWFWRGSATATGPAGGRRPRGCRGTRSRRSGGWMVWSAFRRRRPVDRRIGLFLASNEALGAVGNVGIAVLATIPGGAPAVQPLGGAPGGAGPARNGGNGSATRSELTWRPICTIRCCRRWPSSSATPTFPSRRDSARRQERSCGPGSTTAARLPRMRLAPWAALDGVADEVEADHGVAVDVVAVGDCPLNGHVEALVAAVREAVLNAARHSGADEVSVYAEASGIPGSRRSSVTAASASTPPPSTATGAGSPIRSCCAWPGTVAARTSPARLARAPR